MRLRTAAGTLLALAAPASLAGQVASWDTLPAGRVVERVVSPSDSAERYALYLPSRYDQAHGWPLLVLMDPRGRALTPLELVRPAAERLGFIVVSSYNTASDGLEAPNERAFQAILADLLPRLAVDRHRIYLAGMSGTARLAWDFAFRLPGAAAGVIGFAAGLPVPYQQLVDAYGGPPGFAFFGGAGRYDFNYAEVRALDRTLDRVGVPHRVAVYDGPHGWPPAGVFDAALTWLDGMARGQDDSTRGASAGDSAYRAALASAHATDTRTPVSDAAAEESERLMRQELAFRDTLVDVIQQIRRDPPAATIDPWMDRLGIPALLETASGRDTLAAASAYRQLALMFVEFSFYERRAYMEHGDFERALLVLHIADAVRPGMPQVCEAIAQAARALGRDDACRAAP